VPAAALPSRRMSDVTAIQVGEIEAISGMLEGITFHKAAAAIGGTPGEPYETGGTL
jgi:hypothetical protein